MPKLNVTFKRKKRNETTIFTDDPGKKGQTDAAFWSGWDWESTTLAEFLGGVKSMLDKKGIKL